jgi:hypothetical protein
MGMRHVCDLFFYSSVPAFAWNDHRDVSAANLNLSEVKRLVARKIFATHQRC